MTIQPITRGEIKLFLASFLSMLSIFIDSHWFTARCAAPTNLIVNQLRVMKRMTWCSAATSLSVVMFWVLRDGDVRNKNMLWTKASPGQDFIFLWGTVVINSSLLLLSAFRCFSPQSAKEFGMKPNAKRVFPPFFLLNIFQFKVNLPTIIC